MTEMMYRLDGFLMAPFRWPEDPMAGFWLGAASLVMITVLLGEAGRALARRSHGAVEDAAGREMIGKHRLTMEALQAGDGPAYRAINRLATRALDRTLGLGTARALALVWPAFLAAGWLQLRFDGVVVAEVRSVGLEISAVAAFAFCFVAVRLVLWQGRSRLARQEVPS